MPEPEDSEKHCKTCTCNPTEKRCSKCNKKKPIGEFRLYLASGYSRWKRRADCMSCEAKAKRAKKELSK